MKSSDLREKFLAYFEKKGHKRVRSSSLIPANDPTLYFTNAGMVQFKDVFLGLEKKDYNCATSSQKCMRVSGKHNDLENVGHTPRHHTFFEMLGNFSFGDYFKEKAIDFAWEFLTKEIGLNSKKLIITVFNDDDEAEKLWLRHVQKDRIFRLGEKDNFWSMGDTGPCGPCSEILWDFESGEIKKEDLDSNRFMEIWNLVFMQFNRDEKGKMTPLARPCIDTGMGLERLAAVVNGKKTNWETDLFTNIIDNIIDVIELKGKPNGEELIALRVIADHIRSTTFLIADGVIPSNDGRGYVLRRILRRAIRYGRKFTDKPFLTKLVPTLIDNMGEVYPELVAHQNLILKLISIEEDRFLITLDKGLDILKEQFSELKKKNKKDLSGEIVFKLKDTYGFPEDLTEIISKENGFEIDHNGYEELMNEQRERARSSWKGSSETKMPEIYHDLIRSGLSSEFIGYTHDKSESKVLVIIKDGKRVKKASKGESAQLILDKTPFYGESGGQVGDIGWGQSESNKFLIKDTKRPFPNLIIHNGVVEKGMISEGDMLNLVIDNERRQNICCNHTATHLLHKALREVLGEHVKQSGSLVEPGRFRFDFSHFQAMSDEERGEVEKRVNDIVRKNIPVITQELSYDDAIKKGALAFFDEKYGDKVRVVEVKGFSTELCGGTHLKQTGSIELFRITSESSVGAGLRRIEGATGKFAEEYDKQEQKRLVENKARKKLMQEKKNALKDSIKVTKDSFSVQEINGLRFNIDIVEIEDRKALGFMAENRLKTGLADVVFIATKIEDKIAICGVASKGLVDAKKIHVGNIVKKISEKFAGKGGGRPDFAQGGGKDIEKLDQFIKIVKEILDSQ